MDHLCHESDVSRKSGYESFHRIEALSVRLRQEHPGWGAPKIREKLKCVFRPSRATVPVQAGVRSGPCRAGV